ncbi:hypothetical protein MRX96_054343 [Rhipicephalus microplus]
MLTRRKALWPRSALAHRKETGRGTPQVAEQVPGEGRKNPAKGEDEQERAVRKRIGNSQVPALGKSATACRRLINGASRPAARPKAAGLHASLRVRDDRLFGRHRQSNDGGCSLALPLPSAGVALLFRNNIGTRGGDAHGARFLSILELLSVAQWDSMLYSRSPLPKYCVLCHAVPSKYSVERRLNKGGEREPASADPRRRAAQRPWRRRAARVSRGGDLRTDLCGRRCTEWRGRPPLSGWRPCP